MKTLIEIARKRGSKSTTRAGAWKYLRGWLHEHQGGPIYLRGLKPGRYEMEYRAQWAEQERERRGDRAAVNLGYDINDPSTPGRIWGRAIVDDYQYTQALHTAIVRDGYGCLHPQHRDDYTRERGFLEWQWDAALARVRECKSLPQEYDSISWDHRGRADGGATHHDIMDYDLTSVVVCVRETEGGRYGVKTTCKTYYYISEGEGTETTEPISRLAKTNPPLGSICARLRGEPNGVKLTTTRETYKQMALVDGQMRSIYDGSPWDIGVERREAARRDHNGGLYVYASRARAEKAEYPTSSKLLDAPRVVVRCEARGIHTNYDNGKMAYSSVTPLEIVR